MKLKALLPSLREKKRYVAFEVESKDDISFKDVKETIEVSVNKLIGDLGSASAGIQFLKDWKNNKGILRVNTKYVDHVKASLTLVEDVNNQKIKIKSLEVSGIIDKLRKSYF